MAALAGIVTIVGAVIWIVGSLWFLVTAFKESVLWGLGTLFFPLVGIVFLFVHWKEASKPFGVSLLGAALVALVSFCTSAGSLH